MRGLGFEEVWVLDTEFIARPGEHPEVVCLVADELISGRRVELFHGDFGREPPFRTDAGVLFVGFYLPAEWSCFLELGWPLPERTVDVFVEHRVDRNGIELPHERRGLLDAASFHGLWAMSKDEKTDMRDLVLRGGPWTHGDRRAILDYCGDDVTTTAAVFARQVPAIGLRDRGWGRAMLRGEAMKAIAHVERTGVPLDIVTLDRLRTHWGDIRGDLIARVDGAFGVYENGELSRGRFAHYLNRRGIPWPRTEGTKQLSLDSDTMKDQARLWPELHPLRELQHSLGTMRLFDLEVGADGRNRTGLSPFRARTGRNQPSNSKFIFGPSTWLRGLIQPTDGRALAYIDWASQEVAIVAALSGDEALLEAVRSGDVYLAFAKRAGLVPEWATKDTHPDERDRCKVVVLGMNYGMSPHTLAARLGISVHEARELQRLLARVYPAFTTWAQEQVYAGTCLGHVETVFGWPLHGTYETRGTVLRNFPAQANGAEMLRLANILATRAGVSVCALVHDALLIESSVGDIGVAVSIARKAMAGASALVLGGLEIDTEAVILRHPDRYFDKRGAVMWRGVCELVERRAIVA